MLRSLVLGTILGGLAALAWSTVSWEILGWHEKTLVNFQNEDEVSAVIASHAGKDGTYILPGRSPAEGMTSEQKKRRRPRSWRRCRRAPS